MKIICPKCGKEAERVKTRYGFRNCCCDLWSWDSAPLVDKLTHEARKAAHKAIDVIWKSKLLSRSEVYRRLSDIMGIPSEECHMKLMDAKTAVKVIDAAKEIVKHAGDE